MAKKIKTIVERLDEMIAQYAALEEEAHELMDLRVAEMRAAGHGSIPAGVLKQVEFSNRAGTSLNIRKALELLRDTIEQR